jgi:dTDP-glucose 4,6-dehydratase
MHYFLNEKYNYYDAHSPRIILLSHDLTKEIDKEHIDLMGNIDIIIHLAANSNIDMAIRNPISCIKTNILGTANILEYARKLYNLEAFIFFSTEGVFGSAPEGVSFKERDRYNSTNPYSATKAAGEELCTAYANTYGVPVIITHTMNVIGERQTSEKFIPMCIKKILLGEEITLFADKEGKIGSRMYVHVDDACEATNFILTKKPKCPSDFGGATVNKFNIIGNKEINNLEVARIISDTLGLPLRYVIKDAQALRPGYDSRYDLDGKLLESYGWKITISPEDRIREIVKWYMINDNAKWLLR